MRFCLRNRARVKPLGQTGYTRMWRQVVSDGWFNPEVIYTTDKSAQPYLRQAHGLVSMLA